jgi:hypothetical protein
MEWKVHMTDHRAPDADPVQPTAWEVALAQTLRAPPTPADLRAGVLAAIAREQPIDLAAARRELERDYRAAVAGLKRFYVRRCRDAVLSGSGLLAVVGFSIAPLSHRLSPMFAAAAPMVAGFAMLGVGTLCGALLWRELIRQSTSFAMKG